MFHRTCGAAQVPIHSEDSPGCEARQTKRETAQLAAGRFRYNVMYKPDHITTVKTVKISAGKSLKACERIIFADGKPVKVADIAQRQGEHHLYQADITLLDEHAVLETSAPCWACVEVE